MIFFFLAQFVENGSQLILKTVLQVDSIITISVL